MPFILKYQTLVNTKRNDKKIANDVDEKIPNSTGLVKKTNYNTKIT